VAAYQQDGRGHGGEHQREHRTGPSTTTFVMLAPSRSRSLWNAGLFTSRIDGTPLQYNQDDVYLPDLIVCRPELAERIVAFVKANDIH
jgi:hypothetical protein